MSVFCIFGRLKRDRAQGENFSLLQTKLVLCCNIQLLKLFLSCRKKAGLVPFAIQPLLRRIYTSFYCVSLSILLLFCKKLSPTWSLVCAILLFSQLSTVLCSFLLYCAFLFRFSFTYYENGETGSPLVVRLSEALRTRLLNHLARPRASINQTEHTMKMVLLSNIETYKTKN